MAEEENKGKNRKGQIVNLEGVAYIKAGAFFKGKDREKAQEKIDELVEELKKKKEQ